MSRALTAVRRLRADSGQGLMELVIALTILAVAVSALVALLTSSIVSLNRANTSGSSAYTRSNAATVYPSVAPTASKNARRYGATNVGA